MFNIARLLLLVCCLPYKGLRGVSGLSKGVNGG